jgi:hypothetical protein
MGAWNRGCTYLVMCLACTSKLEDINIFKNLKCNVLQPILQSLQKFKAYFILQNAWACVFPLWRKRLTHVQKHKQYSCWICIIFCLIMDPLFGKYAYSIYCISSFVSIIVNCTYAFSYCIVDLWTFDIWKVCHASMDIQFNCESYHGAFKC